VDRREDWRDEMMLAFFSPSSFALYAGFEYNNGPFSAGAFAQTQRRGLP
jgi:predicted porin